MYAWSKKYKICQSGLYNVPNNCRIVVIAVMGFASLALGGEPWTSILCEKWVTKRKVWEPLLQLMCAAITNHNK